MEKVPQKQSDLPNLYRAYEDLHNRSSWSDFSPAEKKVLEIVRTKIKQAEAEELERNPTLKNLFSVIVGHGNKMLGLVVNTEAIRRYARVLQAENNTELLKKALEEYGEKMMQVRNMQEEIEDSIQLFTIEQGNSGGLFLTVSEFIEPIRPLFINQYDKDEVFHGFIKSFEAMSDDTLSLQPIPDNRTAEVKKPEFPRVVGTAVQALYNRLTPYATAYDLLRMSNSPQVNVAAAWNDKKNAFERYMKEITDTQGVSVHERAQLGKRAYAILRPDEPLATFEIEGKLASIDTVRDMHQRVRAKYSAVQHILTLEQRRHMRTQIAQLSSLVYDAELAHTVSRATEHAPALAHASLAIHRTGTQS